MKKIITSLVIILMTTSSIYSMSEKQHEHLLFTLKNTTDTSELVKELHEIKDDTIAQLNQAKDDCIIQLNASRDELLNQINTLIDKKIEKAEKIAKNSRQDIVVTIASSALCIAGTALVGTGTYQATQAHDSQSGLRAGTAITSGALFTVLGLAGTKIYDTITKN